MGELIVTILIFVAVIAVTAILFGGWLVIMVVTAMGRLLLAPFRRPAETPMLIDGVALLPRCTNDRCRAENPPVASFCRRCGTPMRAAQHVPVRRVAMW
jgi:hypothetical protein